MREPADTLGSAPFGNDHVLMLSPLIRKHNVPHVAADIDARSNFTRLQVPDFLNLTTPHIERHAMLLKRKTPRRRDVPHVAAEHCQPWAPPPVDHILRFTIEDHVQVDYTRVPPRASAKVSVAVRVADLGLSEAARAKFAALSDKRFDAATDTFRMSARRFATRQLNKAFLRKIVEDLVAAANVRRVRRVMPG